jgi:hypothetical protein
MLKQTKHRGKGKSGGMAWVPAVATGASLFLAGCGLATMTTLTGTGPVSAAKVSGAVMGGQQPVAGVDIQLYAVGTGSYGAPSTPLFPANSITTTSAGNFTIPAYACADSNPAIYLVATGGTPIGGSRNDNLAMMTGLGPCKSINQNAFLNVNEVTTVATVWALGRFMTGPTTIGAPSSNMLGLTNAFAAINKVVNTATGAASGPALATGATLPITKINALANVLQNCINSAGGVASDSSDGYTSGTPCGKLFRLATLQGGTPPTDTITAAMNIAQNPALPTPSTPSYVVKLNALQASSPAFSPSLSVNASPVDWTISINYIGGGLNNPRTVATDAAGNVWLTNPTNSSVTKLANTGAALSGPAGFTAGSLNAPWGIAIDTTGNAWVTNSGNNTLTKLSADGTSGTAYPGNGLSTPKGVAIDSVGDIWIANSGANSISEFLPTGAAVGSFSGGGINTPSFIAINPK